MNGGRVSMELGIVLAAHSAIFLFLDFFVFITTFSNRRCSDSQRAFPVFALMVTLSQAVGIAAILCENNIVSLNMPVLYVLYILLMSFSVIVPFSVCRWLLRLFLPKGVDFIHRFKILACLPILFFVSMSVLTFKTHWIFFIDDNRMYQRGSLFFLQIICPYLYLAGICVIILISWFSKKIRSNSKVVKFMALFVLPPIVGSFVQVFLNVKGSFPELGSSVGMILAYMEMYKQDAEERSRLRDVADFNEKLQASYQQMKTLLMRGELQAKTVAESIRGGFKICKNDKVYSIKYLSTQMAEMLGYTVEEMMRVSNGNMVGLVNREDIRRELPKAARQIADDKPYVMNYRALCKDGSWKYVEEKGRLIKTEGAEDEFWSFTVDKDEQVKMESALASVEKSRKDLAEFNEIISNAGLGVWFIFMKDGEHPRMRANEKMREIMGVDPSVVTEEDVYDFWHDRVLESELPSVNASVEEMLNGRFSENTYQWNHPTKGLVYARCGGSAEKQTDGSFVLSGYHCDVSDIVNKDKAQQALLKDALVAAEKSNRAKTVFLNNMSHDIRTPMNAIIGFTSMMEKEKENPEKISDYLKKITIAEEFLLSLINNVLEMARIESGKMELEESCVNLKTGSVVSPEIFDADVKRKNISLTTSFNILHENVYIDVVKMREIVNNLVSNAIKYSHDGGRIELSLDEVPCERENFASYVFTCVDEGVGMSEEYLPHVFESFARECNFTESKIAGTGLGLSIVKKIVDLMGGSISVESVLDKGSTFKVKLDCRICYEDISRQKKDELKVDPQDFKGKRILLAEDNELNAEIAMAVLTEAGFEVDRAQDGAVCADMLEKADCGYYDVVLMDVQMPNMDGYQATRMIRQMPDPARKNIPIIAMTANAFAEDKKLALDAGMNAHVAKPVNVGILMAALSKLIK